MALLTEADRARIEAAVARAERETAGEFVALLVPASARYTLVRLVAPALIALALPAALLALDLMRDPVRIAQAQLAAFVLLASLLQWTPLALALVPRAAQQRNAARLARAQFLELGVDRTADRAGVLLFVSAAEHHVEILADRGIAERVAPAAWQAILDRFVADVRAGRLADGYVAAIDACGGLLAAHFPRPPDDRNELPDAVRQLR